MCGGTISFHILLFEDLADSCGTHDVSIGGEKANGIFAEEPATVCLQGGLLQILDCIDGAFRRVAVREESIDVGGIGTSEQEQFAFNVESAKMDTSGLYRIFPYVGTMDIAIESFQAELNNKYIVFYRNVLRGEENFVQGFAVDLRE